MLRKLWAGWAAIILVTAAGVASAEEMVLNVYNWSDYIAEGTIANFEERTGIEVNYDVFDSNEVLEAKLLAGNSGYDVVVPAASFLERQIVAGVFAKLDKSMLANYGNLDTTILDRVAAHDPDNEHAIPYMWGTTGFGYNVAKVRESHGGRPHRQLAHALRSRRRRGAGKLRGHAARRADRGVRQSHGLSRTRSEQREAGGRGAVRGAPAEGPTAHQVLPLIAEHQRSGQRRDLRGHGLERRHAHRTRPCRGGRTGHRDRLYHPEGKERSSGSTTSPSRATRRIRRTHTCSWIT